MPNEIQAQVLKPFGPRILKALVPKAILDTLNAQCDEIAAGSDHDELDVSNDLVGHV